MTDLPYSDTPPTVQQMRWLCDVLVRDGVPAKINDEIPKEPYIEVRFQSVNAEARMGYYDSTIHKECWVTWRFEGRRAYSAGNIDPVFALNAMRRFCYRCSRL